MRNFLRVSAIALALVSGSAVLSACSDSQVAAANATLTKYDHALDNFQTIAARVDQSVAKTDATVGPYCSQAEQVGSNLGQIVKGNDKAYTALNTISSVLSSWCTSRPTNTGDAVVALTKAIQAGQSALKGS